MSRSSLTLSAAQAHRHGGHPIARILDKNDTEYNRVYLIKDMHAASASGSGLGGSKLVAPSRLFSESSSRQQSSEKWQTMPFVQQMFPKGLNFSKHESKQMDDDDRKSTNDDVDMFCSEDDDDEQDAKSDKESQVTGDETKSLSQPSQAIISLLPHEISLGRHLFMIPDTKSRQSLYLAGPSGSGKSTFAFNYAKWWQNDIGRGDGVIFIFSRLDEDPVLDQLVDYSSKRLKPIRILINDELVHDPIDPVEMSEMAAKKSGGKPALVIFDDIDTIKDDGQKRAVQKLRDDILETGRHQDIYVITTAHLLMNWKATMTSLNEAHVVVFFPHSTGRYQINRFLQQHCGLSIQQCRKVCNIESRWLAVYRHYPQYLMWETGVMLMSSI
jgi:hypothetical protein